MFLSINDGKLPLSQTNLSAGYDVYSNEEVIIESEETKLIKLGISLDNELIKYELSLFNSIFKNLYLGLYLRSSLGRKGLILPNGVGIIDIDYDKEICMIIYNPNKNDFKINRYERLGQLIFQRHYGFDILNNSFRKKDIRIGGLGSTGNE